MIPRTYGHVGKPVRFKGTAYDFGHRIAAIEFSLDEGKNWTRYETPDTNDYQNLSWTFDYVPEKAGFYVLRVRSVNDEGTASPESAFAELLVEEGDADVEVVAETPSKVTVATAEIEKDA